MLPPLSDCRSSAVALVDVVVRCGIEMFATGSMAAGAAWMADAGIGVRSVADTIAMIVVLAETANDVVIGLIIVAAAPVTAASVGIVLVVGAMLVWERAGGKVGVTSF
jgi:hypothetical protein